MVASAATSWGPCKANSAHVSESLCIGGQCRAIFGLGPAGSGIEQPMCGLPRRVMLCQGLREGKMT